MKNENVHMQALHHKLDVVLVQILRYNCSETDYSFREDALPADSALYPDAGFTLRPLQPPLFFCSAAHVCVGGRPLARRGHWLSSS